MKKGIVVFLVLSVLAAFLFVECENRAGNYKAPPIGTVEREFSITGFTIALTHVQISSSEQGRGPLILEDQGFITCKNGKWSCQLSPAAVDPPDYEWPENEEMLNERMDGAANTLAYMQENGYIPTYFFSYREEMFVHAVRSGREYVMPLNAIDPSTAPLYLLFPRPMYMGDFLQAVRNYLSTGSDDLVHPLGLVR